MPRIEESEIRNFGIAVDSEKFLFLFNDLTAAKWVYDVSGKQTDKEVYDGFMELHKIFLSRLSRRERGIFNSVTSQHLIRVVRGWAELYRCTLDDIRREFPRKPSSVDLILGKKNWSALLNISASGLLVIDHCSRYAEFWAERSIKTRNGHSSLRSRLLFVGTPAYKAYADMLRNNNLLALDSFSNGITSYDMMLFIRDSGCSRSNFISKICTLGWRLEVGDEIAIDKIFSIYSNLKEDDLHPKGDSKSDLAH